MSALVEAGTVDQVVEAVAYKVEQLGRMDLREVIEVAREAEVLASAAKLKRYRRIEANSDRAQRALEGLSLQASRRAGELLVELDGGGPGRGKKSPRTSAAEEAGLDGRAARRLVELAEIEEDLVELVREQIAGSGKRLTVRGVIAAATKRTSVGSDEWYTPEDVAEAMRAVFGGDPDWDPASCAVAQRVIRAKRWCSAALPTLGEAEKAAGITSREFAKLKKSHGGVGQIYRWPSGEVITPDEAIEDEAKRAKAFAKVANRGRISHGSELRGKVYANPPYAFPAPFIRAVLEAYLGCELPEGPLHDGFFDREQADAPVTEAILLVNVATGTVAGQWLLEAADAIVWPRGRFSFLDAHGKPQSGNRYEQMIAYLGQDPASFLAEFGQFGASSRPWRAAA